MIMERSQKRKKITVIILLAVVLLGAGLVLIGTRVPELRRMKKLTKENHYTIFVAHDGENITYWYAGGTEEDIALSRELIGKLASCRAVRAVSWSSAEITFPIYSVTVRPSFPADQEDIHGETIAWSNGYLFTSSGKVYRCDIDFGQFMNADRNIVHCTETTGSVQGVNFRPLLYGGGRWNPEFLTETIQGDLADNAIIEASVTGEDKDERGYSVLSVELTNPGEDYWDYSNVCYMEVLVDGTWYSVPYDPSIDHEIHDHMLQNILAPGRTTGRTYYIEQYGDLPPGQYRIFIRGEYAGEESYAFAEYTIK